MEANSLVPKLRFSEFGNNWTYKRLDEVCSSFTYGVGASAKKFDGKNKYLRITDIDDSTNKFIPKPLTSPDCEINDKDYLEEGDIVFARTGASVGKSYLYDKKDGQLVFAGFLIRAKITKANSEFIFQKTKTDKYNRWVHIFSMRSGQPGINAQEYKSYKLCLPPLAEQKKIASFLSSVDKKINLLTKKKALLESYKKGVMQKIFSQEIRFKDEDGKDFPDWEENKLRKFSDKISDGIHSTPKYNNEGQFFFVNGNNLIGGKIIVSEKTKKVDENEFEKHKRLLNNRTILISINGTIGNIALYNNEPIILGKSACYINLNESINKDFMFQYIQSDIISRYFNSQLTGSTIMNLSLSAIKNTPLNLPSLNEQKKIASFLTSVDKKIELVDFQLERNKEFKKGLLQQMFV